MDPIDLLARWGIPLVFVAVTLEQVGLPLPAGAILVCAGALSAAGAMRPEHVLLVAFIACLAADHAWFVAGRLHGRRLLAMLCRVSLSPDTCVRKTDDLIGRHGAKLLVFAKFIPGVSAVAIPTAAAMGIAYRRFILFDAMGSLLWSATCIGAGMIFGREVRRVLDWMGRVGGASLAIVAVLFALYIAWKLARRWRLRRLHRLLRISPEEMAGLLGSGEDLVILDARSATARTGDPRVLPRAVFIDDRDAADVLPADARSRLIVTFCTCPNEASASLLAERLLRSGYERVRILTGGADALELLRERLAA